MYLMDYKTKSFLAHKSNNSHNFHNTRWVKAAPQSSVRCRTLAELPFPFITCHGTTPLPTQLAGFGGVRDPRGSSRSRGSQNSSSGTTANATKHRTSIYFEWMHKMYDVYHVHEYNSINEHNNLSEISVIMRKIVKILCIIVVLIFLSVQKVEILWLKKEKQLR